MKNNLCPPPPSLRWKLVGNSEGVARVEWLGTSEHSADAFLSDSADIPDERSALREAFDFLRELLDGGELSAADVFKRAREAGISERTLERAKRRLGIRHRKQFGSGKFVWFLPDRPPVSAPEGAAMAAVAELAEMRAPGAEASGRLNGSVHGKEADR